MVRDTTQISNTAALLTAGKFLTEGNEFDKIEGCNRADVVLTIDGRNHLKFACLSRFVNAFTICLFLFLFCLHSKKFLCRESQLLVALRSNLADTCDYLLRSAGLQRKNELPSIVGNFHGRQVDVLARLLLFSSNIK